MTAHSQGVGQPGFAARHGLLSAEQAERANEVAERIRIQDLRTVRLAVIDQHGVPRAKNMSPDAAIAALTDGLDFSGAIYSFDTGNTMFVPPFARGGGFGIEEFTGCPDVMLVPDPATFKVLPWADQTGWMLCDSYFVNGRPVPVDSRGLLRRKLTELAAGGYDFVAGIELEFYIVALDQSETLTPENAGFSPPPPKVSVFERGYQYLSEARLDSMSETLEAIRDALTALGLPPRSIEDEWGPGQVELSFSPLPGLAAADAAVLFRSAVKQVCQRRGLLATFMCRPALPNFFSSGFHLHQSLNRPDRSNAFASADDPLSDVGRRYVAGLLEHAAPMAVFAAPTVNGYKRFRPYSFAPDRVCWAVENRGALVRVQGSPGDANSHVEMRLGEPAANPYLYMAANVAAGLDGIRRRLEPPPPVSADPYAAQAPPLPASLSEAVAALDADQFYRSAFGATLVDYLVMMKRSEIRRYEDALASEAAAAGSAGAAAVDVSEWEMREYFEFF